MIALFDQLLVAGEAGLRALVDTRRQEDVHLDFKSKSDPRHGALNDDDKRTLGQALSGFANSAGGLLIFGVDARPGGDKVDCAQGLIPIAEIERFGSLVNTLIGELLSPRHEGIQVAIIPAAADPATGYLLVGVERSARRPHRCEAKGRKSYYKRAGASFYEMEHFDIEDAFNRMHVPRLSLGLTFEAGSGTYKANRLQQFTSHALLNLTNPSSKTGKFPYVSVNTGRPIHGYIGGSENSRYELTYHGGWATFSGSANHVINPGMSTIVSSMPFNLIAIGKPGAWLVDTTAATNFEIVLRCRYGCEDSRMREMDLTIRGEDLLTVAPRLGVVG